MSNDWFRSWHGAPTDNKWLLIAKRASVKPIHVSGTWWALLDHASQHSDRGFVGDFDQETFALFAGMEEEHVSRIVTALCDKGLIVDDRIGQWGKRQPKREDETAGDRQRKRRANNGGKPPNNGGDGPREGIANDDCHAMSRNVTPDKDEIREDSSVANATGTVVPHPAADFCKAIFDSGVTLLTATGMTERSSRSLLGRLRQKMSDDPGMLTILRQAEIEQPSEPAAWLTAAVESRNGRRKLQSDLRGSRPDPSLDLLRAARAAEEAEHSAGSGEDHRGAWLALPSGGSG